MPNLTSNLVSAVIRSEGKKGAFIFGGPKRYRLYAGGIGPVRDAPAGENCIEYIGTLESLDQQFLEAKNDNAISRGEYDLLTETVRRARAKAQLE